MKAYDSQVTIGNKLPPELQPENFYKTGKNSADRDAAIKKFNWEYLKTHKPNGSQFSKHLRYLEDIVDNAPNALQAINMIKEVSKTLPDNRDLYSLYESVLRANRGQPSKISDYLIRNMPEDAHYTGGGFFENSSKFHIANGQLEQSQKKSGIVYTDPNEKRKLEYEKLRVKMIERKMYGYE
jgi:hypothetical protein